MWPWRRQKTAHPLKKTLFLWSEFHDPYRLRDLLNWRSFGLRLQRRLAQNE